MRYLSVVRAKRPIGPRACSFWVEMPISAPKPNSSLLFGSVMTLAYSVAGAVLSLTVMVVLKHIDKLSAVGVSVAGGIMHNIGQIAVAVILLDTPEIAYYMLVLALTGTVSGIFVGLCGALVLRRVPVEKIFKIR